MESLRFDFNPHKDLVGVYLELWKRDAKKKVIFSCLNPRHIQEKLWCSFSLRASVLCSSTLIFTCLDIGQVNLGEALRQLYEDDVFPSRKALIKYALDSCPDTSLIKHNVGSSMS